MSIFDKIFNTKEERDYDLRWHYIESHDDLKQAVERSYSVSIVIFKHSTRCFISKTVLKNFEKEIAAYPGEAEFYFLDLLAHRDISNAIASEFQVTHQSPQMIVVKDGKAIKNASHHSISANLL